MRSVGNGKNSHRIAEAIAKLASVFRGSGYAIFARLERLEPAGITGVDRGAGEREPGVAVGVDSIMHDGG